VSFAECGRQVPGEAASFANIAGSIRHIERSIEIARRSGKSSGPVGPEPTRAVPEHRRAAGASRVVGPRSRDRGF
jgi:hypothetical protein